MCSALWGIAAKEGCHQQMQQGRLEFHIGIPGGGERTLKPVQNMS